VTQCYRFIKQEKANHPIHMLCRVIKVSRSGFYDWCVQPASKRASENAKLLECIFEGSYRRYGYRCVLRVLLVKRFQIGKHRVTHLMHQNSFVARRRRTFCVTTDSKHAFFIALNQLNHKLMPPTRHGSAISRTSRRPRAGYNRIRPPARYHPTDCWRHRRTIHPR